MIKTLKRTLLTMVLAAITSMAFSQGTVKGVVVDASNNEKLIGATVLLKGTTIGTSSDSHGNFTLNLPAGKQTILIQFVGYTNKEIEVAIKNGEVNDLGIIKIESDQIGIAEVAVFASVAISRKTPVALSKIDPIQIEEKLGTQEFPEILKSTPGVYATKQGGAFGDSRINLRGFESANVAVMINGVPVNDMEWGGVYWSNWAGLNDVTRSMQVQRGLGASKVAAPSLGGSINIVTRSTDVQKGGTVSYGIGNDGLTKIGFSVSTGLTEKGWALTILGAKSSGNGYIQGTEFETYTYFVNISKRINDHHQISFTGFGAPQWHNQRNNNDRLLISEWQRVPGKYRYNATYGFDMNGQRKTSARNSYHKPQFSLNHFWTINEKSSLSTAIYASIGNGYGTSGQSYASADRSAWYGASTSTGLPTGYTNISVDPINNPIIVEVPFTMYDDNTEIDIRSDDGTYNYGAIYDVNKASLTGSKLAMSKSINQHKWFGLLSTYSTKFLDQIDFYGGIDLRYYKGTHTNVITDLYGGDYFIDQTSRPLLADQSYKTKKLGVGDVVYRDYDGIIWSEGVFAQAEYNQIKNLSVFVSASVSNTSSQRYDRFYYDRKDARSSTENFWGYCIKGGANYNLTDNHNVFANVGIISRAPFFSSGVFLQSATSNTVNPDAINEKAVSAEVGYGFHSQYLSANLNLYRTLWKNKTLVRSSSLQNGTVLEMNIEGLDALHQGIELDFVAKPIRNLEITGMASLGDWKWNSNGKGALYTTQGAAWDYKGNQEVPVGDSLQTRVNINIDGIHVGNSAQTTAAVGLKYEMLKGFKVGIDCNYFGRNYANFNISLSDYKDITYAQPWKMPDATTFDLNMSYRFKLNTFDATLIGNVNNLFDTEYIADATDGSDHSWKTAQVFYGFGRTYSVSLKLKF